MNNLYQFRENIKKEANNVEAYKICRLIPQIVQTTTSVGMYYLSGLLKYRS